MINMPENPELRKIRQKKYEDRKKENYTFLKFRISIDLKKRFKEKIEKDSKYTDMSEFIIKSIEKYLE